MVYFAGGEKQRRWSDCADAQVYLHLCCSREQGHAVSRRGPNGVHSY